MSRFSKSVKTVEVNYTVDGETATYKLYELSAAQRYGWLDWITDPAAHEQPEEGMSMQQRAVKNTQTMVRTMARGANLVAMCLSSGSKEDIEQIEIEIKEQCPEELLERLFDAAQKLNNLDFGGADDPNESGDQAETSATS